LRAATGDDRIAKDAQLVDEAELVRASLLARPASAPRRTA